MNFELRQKETKKEEKTDWENEVPENCTGKTALSETDAYVLLAIHSLNHYNQMVRWSGQDLKSLDELNFVFY